MSESKLPFYVIIKNYIVIYTELLFNGTDDLTYEI